MKVKKLLLMLVATIIVLAAFSSCELINSSSEHEHSYGEWEEMTAATCIKKGVLMRKCECGAVETSSTPLQTHTEVIDPAVEATCTETGLTEGKHCLHCDEVIVEQQVIETKGHTSNDGICVVCETITDPLVALCKHVRTNANVTQNGLSMISDFRYNEGTNAMYALVADKSVDELAFLLYYESSTDTVTIYVIVDEVKSTYEVYFKYTLGSEVVECSGKIVASDINEDYCEVLNFKCDAAYSSESETLKQVFEDLLPLTVSLADQILDKQDIDIDLADFGFTQFDS